MADNDKLDDLQPNLDLGDEETQVEDAAEAEVKKPAPKKAAPKKRASRQTKPKNTVRIQLEENDDIPPTGLYVGHNGKGYLIEVGKPVDVPKHIVEILDNAVMSSPTIDPGSRQVVGYKDRMRYPYRRLD